MSRKKPDLQKRAATERKELASYDSFGVSKKRQKWNRGHPSKTYDVVATTASGKEEKSA